MTAPETAVRPTWVEELVARHAEPVFECPDPIKFADRTRRCWAWSCDGVSFKVLIDHISAVDLGRWWRTWIEVGARTITVTAPSEPTDDEMRALVALGWGEAS